MTAGSLAALIGIGALLAIGHINDYEGRVLLEATIPTTRFLCSALITAAATILALMLTILSFTDATDHRLSDAFYGRIRKIARHNTVVFVLSVLFLLLISVPLPEGQNVPSSWHDIIYYTIIGFSCVLAGLVVTVVVQLYQAIDSVIVALGIGVENHPVLRDAPTDDSRE